MTGPALLLGLFFAALSGYFRAEPGLELLSVLVSIVIWPVSVLAVFWAGRLLTHKGYFTRTLRGLGFAQIVFVVDLLALVPPIAPLALILTAILSFLATWMGAAEAHETRGWRTFVLPLLSLIVTILIPVILIAMVGGLVIGLESILARLGLVQP
jgi:hypothetical protein